VAIVNVALERVKFDALLDRYPWLKSLQKFKNDRVTPGSRAFNIAWRSGKVLGKEYITENAQNIVEILGRQMLEELDPKVKDVPIGKALDDLFASQERILFALLPFLALASGRIGLHDLRDYNELLRNPKNLSYLGLSEDQIIRITSEPDPEKASAILQEEYAKINQQERQKGVKKLVKAGKNASVKSSFANKRKRASSASDIADADSRKSFNAPEELSLSDKAVEDLLQKTGIPQRKTEISDPKDWSKVFGRAGIVRRVGKPLEKILGVDLSDLELTLLSGAPEHSALLVEGFLGRQPHIKITVKSSDSISHVRRIFRNSDGTLSIRNVSFIRVSGVRGYGAHSLATQIKAAQQLGFKRIEAFAMGDGEGGTYVGPPVWSRLGFDRKLSMAELANLPHFLKNVKSINDIVLTPGGHDWLKKNIRSQEMFFDLDSKSDSIKIFKDYLRENDYNIYLYE